MYPEWIFWVKIHSYFNLLPLEKGCWCFPSNRSTGRTSDLRHPEEHSIQLWLPLLIHPAPKTKSFTFCCRLLPIATTWWHQVFFLCFPTQIYLDLPSRPVAPLPQLTLTWEMKFAAGSPASLSMCLPHSYCRISFSHGFIGISFNYNAKLSSQEDVIAHIKPTKNLGQEKRTKAKFEGGFVLNPKNPVLHNNLWRTAEQQSFVKYFYEINPVVYFISFVFVSRFLHMRAWNFLFIEIIKYGSCLTNAESSSQDFFFFSSFAFKFISGRYKPLHPLETVWDLSVIEKEVY